MVIINLLVLAFIFFLLPFVTNLEVNIDGKKDGFKAFKIKAFLYLFVVIVSFVAGYHTKM